MNILKVKLSKINPAPYNPRKDLKPDDPQYQMLLKSIDEFGFVEPLVWNKKTGNLVGGHQRFKILQAKGIKETSVSVVDLSPEKEKALNITLNKVTGEWDMDRLKILLDELCKVPDFQVELTGFKLPEIENMLADVTDKDSSGEKFNLKKELESACPPVTKTGDIIELGSDKQHRLLCGDATKQTDVNALMQQCRAALCHTDPPYGVNYDRRNRPVSAKQKKAVNPQDARSKKLRNDDLTPKRYKAWLTKVTVSLAEVLVPGGAYYIWNSHKQFGLMHELLSEKNFKVSSVITWAKESFSPNFSDYNEQVEYCLYGWKTGAKHKWYGPNNESTLWKINRDRTTAYSHPTQKALELAERAIRNSSKQRDIVFDPFLGSGTTLIAAARLGRRCFGIEIEPRYCDCIVRRYISLAGENAIAPEIAQKYRVDSEKN
ncbi:site-specific DNA-methyltransferase [Planctomycetota bacterium]